MIRHCVTFDAQGPRPAQEDRAEADLDRGIYVAADGFGGVGHGPEAARMACEAIRGFLDKGAGDRDATMPFVLRRYFSLSGNILFNALVHANRKLQARNRGKHAYERAGACVLAAYAEGGVVCLANAGSCGAVLVRGGRAQELVIPRSWLRLREPLGCDRERAARLSIPLMGLGLSDDFEPEVAEIRMQPGDWLALATDGWDARELGTELASLQTVVGPEEAPEEIRAALGAGANRLRENAAVVVLIA